MNNVTAVVLTIGEDTLERAIKSLNGQSMPLKEIVIVKNVTPFYRAYNYGVSKVKTEFFIQIDADMILDHDCVEFLYKCMSEKIGVVVGHLRDTIIPRVCGIKMFRKDCFRKVSFKNSISPDTDFIDDVTDEGWRTVYALRFSGDNKGLWHTFGEHRPEYTTLYTYSKYILEGKRYRYRGAFGGLKWHLKELQKSGHRAALIAQIAMSHGLFMQDRGDLLAPYRANEDHDFLEKFLNKKNGSQGPGPAAEFLGRLAIQEVFRKYYEIGMGLRENGSFSGFSSYMDSLQGNNDNSAFIAIIGLCHGLFFKKFDRRIFNRDLNTLRELTKPLLKGE